MLPVAQTMNDPAMVGFQSLPKYEFVQDIEEMPDVSIEEIAKLKAISVDPVDSFWFFELDTPKGQEKSQKIMDLSNLGATATVETSSSSTASISSSYISANSSSTDFADLDLELEMPSKDMPPIRAPGTYQLFMPDPEMMDRLGELGSKSASQNRPKNPINNREVCGGGGDAAAVGSGDDALNAAGSIPLTRDPTKTGIPMTVAVQDNSHLTVPASNLVTTDKDGTRGRRSRSGSTKRVMIADPPVSGSQSPPPPPTPRPRSGTGSSTTRIVSYQRPRLDRSKSRATRIKEAMSQPVNPAYTDRKTMENLNASMRSASELLQRRRAEGTSRYVDQYPSSVSGLERGRTSARYIPSEPAGSIPDSTHTSYRSATSRAAGGGQQDHSTDRTSGGSLWGLLDMAQSWIMKPVKSRRDRSEEQSRTLMRKSRTLNS